jgi:predicted LPLAT superfamily acyltransferase
VVYPPGNTSNFDLLRDNWRITCMHTRLVLGMLLRLPSILAHRPRRIETAHRWSALAERGTYLGLRIAEAALRLFGRRGCKSLLAPVVLYFYLTGREQRAASRAFLARAFAAKGMARASGWRDGFRHFRSFAGRAVDAFAAWSGSILPADVDGFDDAALRQTIADPRGVLFIVAHVGNSDLARALLDAETRARLTVLVHTVHAENFNRVLRERYPAAAVNMVQVTEIGPETAIALKQRIERGEWVVIAGDRQPVHGGTRVSRVPFLGADAAFSQGPFILAALLGCPVFTLFCMREGGRYRLHCEKLADRIELPRGDRAAALRQWTAQFARRLEQYALVDPFQWYNFFDFWADGHEETRGGC